jgi:hypothetical protein
MIFKLAQTTERTTASRNDIIARPSEEWTPFLIVDRMAVLRLSGHYLLSDAVRAAKATILAAKSHRIGDVLINATEITGFDPPSVAARHALVRELAFAADSAVRLAAVLRRDMIDPHKFGVVAARNFGFIIDVFACERDAVEWLRDKHLGFD